MKTAGRITRSGWSSLSQADFNRLWITFVGPISRSAAGVHARQKRRGLETPRGRGRPPHPIFERTSDSDAGYQVRLNATMPWMSFSTPPRLAPGAGAITLFGAGLM